MKSIKDLQHQSVYEMVGYHYGLRVRDHSRIGSLVFEPEICTDSELNKLMNDGVELSEQLVLQSTKVFDKLVQLIYTS